MYSDHTNQVPATWFAGDAGIRRLALQSDGPVHRGRRRVLPQCFRSFQSDQLQCSPEQSLGISKALFGLADGRPKIFSARRNSERTDFGELLPISLYVFGDDRQSCRDWVVHGVQSGPSVGQIESPSLAVLSVSWPPVHSVTVRDDLRALEGYHSPQVDVRIRLNTNEAPTPPPAAWRDAFAAELSRVEWHRYPDRSASALRAAIAESHHVRPDQVFAANGSNEVLQTLLLAYAGPGRRVVTFEPTYQMHGHIARLTGCDRGRGRARRPTSGSTSMPRSA